MRIVYDYQVFAFQAYGGISRYIVRLMQHLGRLPGHSCRAVAPLYVNGYLRSLPASQVSGVHISSRSTNQRIARQVGKHFGRHLIARDNPDIVHETYYARSPSAPRGVPTVLTVHDMIHEKFAQHFAASDPTAELKRIAVRRADLILCNSENTRRDLVDLIPEAEHKAVTTYLGFDRLASDDTIQPLDRPYLLYVGERGGYKNFAKLLGVYARSPALHRHQDLVCFGGGSPRSEELARIRDLGLPEGRVRFVSGNDGKLAAYYWYATAFVYPSLYEGFGIPPLEAMALSCPVAASGRSSIPEVCGDAAAYFDPEDGDSMQHTLEMIVTSTDVRNDLVARGLERLERFAWDRCAQATHAEYARLL